jgi:lysophospholipase L1-like esterase
MSGLTRIFFICLLALCAGCGGHPSIRKLSASSVVVAYGDSLTSGIGAGAGESYPSVLSGMLACPVINAGVPGEDTAGGLRRLPGVLEKEQPQLVILCHGGNDMLNKLDQQVTIANLEAMISMVKGAGADIILVGVPKPGILLKKAPFYRELAAKHRIPFDPGSVSKILSSRALKSDYVHPNAAGYRRLAESLVKLIRESQK